jgi:hypothetical protein
MSKFVLEDHDIDPTTSSENLATAIITRVGLLPRKKGSTEKMHNVLLEFYERAKAANRDKKPESAVMTVEHMANHAGISRQTMYEYLGRWLDLCLIVKTSFISDGKVIVGYRLNGPTLETAFQKVQEQVNGHLDTTLKLIQDLQKSVKNEKISQSQKINQLKDFSEN